MSKTEAVDEWVDILFADAKERKEYTPYAQHRARAWELARQEEEIESLRYEYQRRLGVSKRYEDAPSPASQELDHEAIRRLIDEARGIHGAAQALAALPHVQRHEFIVTQLQCVAQAAQAILDGLVKLR